MHVMKWAWWNGHCKKNRRKSSQTSQTCGNTYGNVLENKFISERAFFKNYIIWKVWGLKCTIYQTLNPLSKTFKESVLVFRSSGGKFEGYLKSCHFKSKKVQYKEQPAKKVSILNLNGTRTTFFLSSHKSWHFFKLICNKLFQICLFDWVLY